MNLSLSCKRYSWTTAMILALLSAIQVPHAIADGGSAYSVYDKNRAKHTNL
jgi:hypothetical protein